MRYFFIFGREPELSRAELISKVQIEKINLTVFDEGADFVIADAADGLNLEKFISELGGTIKIGTVQQKITKLGAETLFNLIQPRQEKIKFGISAYGLNLDIDELGRKIKKLLSCAGAKSRFVASKKYPLSSVIVQKELLKNGLELALLKTKNQLYVGQTLAVQPFEQFSALDYGRPARDARAGMLPPKLATIMLNLSEAQKNEILLDPFCGSGTVLQQALLLGYQKVIGADASLKAVQSTRKNIEWLSARLRRQLTCEVRQTKIENLTAIVAAHSVDAVVTEPYLGPTLSGAEDEKQIKGIIAELERFYQTGFDALFNILRPNGTLVIVVPELPCAKRTYCFSVEPLITDKFKIIGQWHYHRPDQFVARQIFKMIKIK
jgi:tRNA G10  N-methylase Trm11